MSSNGNLSSFDSTAKYRNFERRNDRNGIVRLYFSSVLLMDFYSYYCNHITTSTS